MANVCEVCGKPATMAVQDFEELPPEYDSEGRGWRRGVPAGEAHWYCDEHARESRIYVPMTEALRTEALGLRPGDVLVIKIEAGFSAMAIDSVKKQFTELGITTLFMPRDAEFEVIRREE